MTPRYDTCALCGEEILDLSHSKIAKQVVGWSLPRRAGGQNTVALRYETGALAHVSCVKLGKYQDQARLWSEEQEKLFG